MSDLLRRALTRRGGVIQGGGKDGVGSLAFGDGLPVLMTEKDAVKCTAFATDLHWCVPVRAELPPAFFDHVANALAPVGIRPH